MAYVNNTTVLDVVRHVTDATPPARFHPACCNDAWLRILALDNRLTREENAARRAAAEDMGA